MPKTLPNGKTPAQAAHDFVLAFVTAGQFAIPEAENGPEVVARRLIEVEEAFTRVFQEKCDSLHQPMAISEEAMEALSSLKMD